MRKILRFLTFCVIIFTFGTTPAHAVNPSVSSVTLTNSGQASGTLKVSWVNPDPASYASVAGGFFVELINANTSTVDKQVTILDGSSVQISGLVNGTSYNARVTALYEDMAAMAVLSSNAAAASLPPAVPDQPNAPFAERMGPGQVKVTWAEPLENGSPIEKYSITCSPSCPITEISSNEVSISGLVESSAYTFKVSATNAIGPSIESLSSNEVKPFGTIVPPTSVTATKGFTSLQLEWSHPSVAGLLSNSFRYSIYLYEATNLGNAVRSATGLQGVSKSFDGLTSGVSYIAKISMTVEGITSSVYTTETLSLPVQSVVTSPVQVAPILAAPTGPVPMAKGSKPTLASVASNIGMSVPAKSKVSVTVAKSSKKICKTQGSKLVATAGGSCTVTVTVKAPKPAAVTQTGSFTVSGGTLSANQVAAIIGASVPAKSKITITVAGASKKICSASGSKLKVKSAGTCTVKMKIQAPQPGPVKKTSTIAVN